MKKKSNLIDQILSQARQHLPKAQVKAASVFIREFYTDLKLSDLALREVRDLCGAVLFHWQLLYTLKQKRKIVVFNPTLAQHGWHSENTVIAIAQKDMPFLVDSLKMELHRLGCNVRVLIHLGGIKIERAHGRVSKVIPIKIKGNNALAEAPIYIEIERQADEVLADIQTNLERILDDVKMVVADWSLMVVKINAAIIDVESMKESIETEEVAAFLRWLADNKFTFLGYSFYDVVQQSAPVLSVVRNSKLGILRKRGLMPAQINCRVFPKKIRQQVVSRYPLMMFRSDILSTVHRAGYVDVIEIKRFDARGKMIGIHYFAGLYGSIVYYNSIRRIPILRQKAQQVVERFGYPANGYAAKTLLSILETLPRDDFIQADMEELYRIGVGIFRIHGKRLTRLFVFQNAGNNYASCLVYVPKDNFNTVLRVKIQEMLVKAFAGQEISFNVSFTDPVLARIHFVIRLGREKVIPDLVVLEQQIIKVSRSWYDELSEELAHAGVSSDLGAKYAAAFPAGYCETFAPHAAAIDVAKIEQLNTTNPLAVDFYSQDDERRIFGVKLFSLQTLQLSDVLPVLENLGLKVISEQAYLINLSAKQKICLNYLQVIFMGEALAISQVKEKFIATLRRVLAGAVENDGFNRLILSAEFSWREAELFRAYAKYLLQIKFPFSQQYLESTLARHSAITKLLLAIFSLRFNPQFKHKNISRIAKLNATLVKKLDAVTSLEEDRVIRQFHSLILATMRTNYYSEQLALAFKFAGKLVPDLPLPCPLFEIFVYALRFEGVHLRMARVARGGIRWSDRRDDFRTEILGLMKAQQVKNVVIVPYGAKGGFVLKQIKEDMRAEAVACYQSFIRGLLSLTDNIVDGKIVHPSGIICYDEVDPYLVVAADKGTANFSDIANKISREHNFWLDDAFASGGITGYNHKDIGITARGAWESVKLHLANLGINGDFTVVGIGDMSGDVFGNGMLLSRHIKLIGAFDHRHIFLDPNPDPERSFKERQRLFKLSRSSWDDYNKKLISKGGGIYARALKTIPISAEMQKVLGIKKTLLAPHELISALLQSPVDLLWNGGIGTYIKASNETNSEVGDKNNDNLRVDANTLRCKVVAEGGNLGLTQLGRIEYALRGGKINTDFIDNSGGVNCSDHEVNIKILLRELIQRKKFDAARRNVLLRSMTEEVADLVLENNARQAKTIDLIASQSIKNMGLIGEYLTVCERAGKINRILEFLPSERVIAERKALRLGLTSPEAAVLSAYSKIILKEKILQSNVPDLPYFERFLNLAFPAKLQRFSAQFKQHRLRREIISTELSNDFTTLMGITFVYELQKEMAVTVTDILCAYAIAVEVFMLKPLLQELDALDIDAALKKQLMLELCSILRRAIKWLLRNYPAPLGVEAIIKKLKNDVGFLSQNWQSFVVGYEEKILRQKFEALKTNVPDTLAKIPVISRMVDSILNIVKIANNKKIELKKTASVYFKLRDKLDLFWMFEYLSQYIPLNNWEFTAKNNLRNDLDRQQRKFVTLALQDDKKGNINHIFNFWLSKNADFYQHWQQNFFEIRQADTKDFAIIYMVGMELLVLAKRFNLS